MASIAKLVVAVGASIAGFETDMKRASNITQREMRKMERQAVRTGKIMGAAVAGGLALAIREASKFERAIAEVSTLLDDTSSLDSMTDSVKALSKEFGQSPTNQAKALYQIISSGAEAGAEAIDVLRASNKLAVGGLTDVKTAADGLTTVLNVYGDKAGSASDISDKLFAAMKAGKTTIEELSSGMGQAIGTAEALGVSFDELVAAGSTLASTGITTKQAFTGLRQVFANILEPQGEAAELAKKLELNFGGAALQGRTFAELLNDVARATGGNLDQMAKLFGSVEALELAFKLTGSASEQFKKTLDDVQNSAGETDKAVAKVAETVSQAFERLKAAISVELIDTGTIDGLADAIDLVAANIDLLSNFIKTFATVVLGGLLISSITKTVFLLKDLSKGVITARIAFASLLGVLGLVSAAAASVYTAYQRIQEIFRAASADIERSTTLLYGQADALLAVADATGIASLQEQLQEKISKTTETIEGLENELALANAEFERLATDGGAAAAILLQQQSSRIEELEIALRNANRVLNATSEEMEEAAEAAGKLGDDIENLGDSAGKAGDEIEDYAKKLQSVLDSLDPVASEARELAKTLDELTIMQRKGDLTWDQYRKAVQQATAQFDKAVDELRGITRATEEAARAQQKLIDASQAVIDQLDEGGALQREFIRDLEDLKAGFDEAESGGLTLDEAIQLLTDDYFRAIEASEGLASSSRNVADELGNTGDAAKRAASAMDESVRIMENIFQDLFSGLVGESDEAWAAIENGFQQMVGRISSTSFRGILDEFRTAFGEGGGGFGSIDFKGVGLQFGQIAASAFADDIVTGIFGDTDTGTDYVEIGKQIGTVVGSIIGSVVFAWLGPAGTTLGGILGSFAGALDGLIFGKLFGRKAETSIGGANAAGAGPEDQSIITALGEVFSLHAQGGVGGFLELDTVGEEIGKAITSLDQAIFDILKSVGGADQLAVIQDALDNWEGTWKEGALTIEDILGSRFGVILSTFSDHVQDFVTNVDDIQEQVERFGIALQVDKLFEELPDALGGRTQAEFLSIIESYKGAFQSMGEAADEVIGLFVEIAAQLDFLSGFAGSSLAADFDQILSIQGRSLEEALAAANSQLVDALANFDGSIGSLQEISGLVFSIREGEIQLLQQIDDVQKGLAARLQTLREDILGVTAQPKSITETLLDAEGLLRAVQGASSASEIADIGQQFDALVRGLTEEQTALAQSDLLTLVDAFENLSNLRLGELRDDALSNSEVIRTAVDDFIARIGDPLDIIAASLDGNIGETMNEGFSEVADNNTANTDRIIQALYATAGQGSVIVVNPDAGLVNQ